MKKVIHFIFIILIFLSGCVSVNRLLEQKNYGKALNYCSKQQAPKQALCYKELAEYFFSLKDYERAYICFEKAGSGEEGAGRIANVLLADKNFPANNQTVYQYFEKAGMAQPGAKEMAAIILGKYSNPELAYDYYQKAGMAREGAREVADFLLNAGVLNKKPQDLKSHLDQIFKYFELGETADEGARKLGSLLLNNNISLKDEQGSDNMPEIIFKYYEKAGIAAEGASLIAQRLMNTDKFSAALRYFEKSGNSENVAEQIGNKLMEKKFFESAMKYYMIAGKTDQVEICKSNIYFNLNKLSDGSTICNGIPVKNGLFLSDQFVVMNTRNGEIGIRNLYSGGMNVISVNETNECKDFRLINDDIDLLFITENTLNQINIIDGVKKIFLLKHSLPVSSFTIVPEYRNFFTGSWDETINYSGMESLKIIQSLKGHKAGITSLTCSDNGDIFASGSWDSTAVIWDIRSGKEKFICNHGSSVTQISLSGDGKYLVSCAKDKLIKLWNTATGELINTLRGHNSYVNSVAVSPDNRWIISGDMDGVIKIWDLRTRNLVKSIQAYNTSVTDISISPNSGYFVTCGLDFRIKFWWLENKSTFLSQFAR